MLGIAEPIQIEDLQGRKGLGSNNLFPNQIFMRNLRRVLEDFINTNIDDGELQFTSEFNSEERKSIHKEALRLHLTSNSIGREGERRVSQLIGSLLFCLREKTLIRLFSFRFSFRFVLLKNVTLVN